MTLRDIRLADRLQVIEEMLADLGRDLGIDHAGFILGQVRVLEKGVKYVKENAVNSLPKDMC